MKSKRVISLALKIIIPIVITQTIVMVVAGIYFTNKFSADIDERVTSQIQIPGKLMNKGLLNFEALSKKETMIEIVGKDLVESMVIGFDKTVYYSINTEDIGKNVDQIKRIDLKNFAGSAEDLFINDQDDGGDYIASITPIYSAVGKAPFLFAYIKIRTEDTQNQKNTLKIIFIVGSLLAVSVTSAVIIFLLNIIFLSNVKRLRTAVEMVGRGNLGPEVIAVLPQVNDELGILSKGFGEMVTEIKKSRAGLELEVEKRTQELKDSRTEVILNLDKMKEINSELGRMNKLMVDRELKMIELKKRITEL